MADHSGASDTTPVSLDEMIALNDEIAALVRANATVPRSLLRPLSASLAIGGFVGLRANEAEKPPPWIMKFSITR